MQHTIRKFKSASGQERVKKISNHPFVLPVGIIFVSFAAVGFITFMLLGGHSVGSANTRMVHLYFDGKTQTIPTDAPTVGEMLDRLHVPVGDHDVVEPARGDRITDDNFNVNVYKAQPVAIVDKDHRMVAYSAASTARSIVKQAGITVYPEDKIEAKPTENFVQDGVVSQKVVIDRATPTTINLYGETVAVRTHAKTVGDVLRDKHVELAKDDVVTPAPTSPVAPDTQIYVTRFGTQVASAEEAIPMPSETVEDSSLSVGSQAVRQKGAPGKKLVTYQVELKNGKEVSRHKIQETIVVEPVKQIVARGPFGSFGDALARLRMCEAGGRYDRNSGNGFYGAYQFMPSSWAKWAPDPYKSVLPHEAPPAAQDQAVWNYYKVSGWNPWPGCKAKLGLQDIYR